MSIFLCQGVGYMSWTLFDNHGYELRQKELVFFATYLRAGQSFLSWVPVCLTVCKVKE